MSNENEFDECPECSESYRWCECDRCEFCGKLLVECNSLALPLEEIAA